ncbi:MAG: SMI1/KNR4 family protein [Archangiaceae bacterium]|nr:SMI1/KNR4 family protein [Archangiaceae bacterium]
MESRDNLERFRSAYSDWCDRAFKSAPDPSFGESAQLQKSGVSGREIKNMENAMGCRFPLDFSAFLATTRAEAWLLPPNVILLQFDLPSLLWIQPADFIPIGLLENQGITLGFDKVDKTQPELPIHALDEKRQLTRVVCSSFSKFLAALALMMETLDPLRPDLVSATLLAQLRDLDPSGIGAAGLPIWSRILARKGNAP